MTRSLVLPLALAVALASSPADGFSFQSSFARRNILNQKSQAKISAPYNRNVMSMNLFDRFSRVAKSNLNNVLKSLEDPEKIMNQAVEDMQVKN